MLAFYLPHVYQRRTTSSNPFWSPADLVDRRKVPETPPKFEKTNGPAGIHEDNLVVLA
jgi:hypothetical protein